MDKKESIWSLLGCPFSDWVQPPKALWLIEPCQVFVGELPYNQKLVIILFGCAFPEIESIVVQTAEVTRFSFCLCLFYWCTRESHQALKAFWKLQHTVQQYFIFRQKLEVLFTGVLELSECFWCPSGDLIRTAPRAIPPPSHNSRTATGGIYSHVCMHRNAAWKSILCTHILGRKLHWTQCVFWVDMHRTNLTFHCLFSVCDLEHNLNFILA